MDYETIISDNKRRGSYYWNTESKKVVYVLRLRFIFLCITKWRTVNSFFLRLISTFGLLDVILGHL